MKRSKFIGNIRTVTAVTACLLWGALPLVKAAGSGLESYEPWSEEIVEIFRKIPILDEGRIKPFDSFSQFQMYRLHGKRSMRFTAGSGDKAERVKIGPTEWMLDVLFRPEVAAELPTFQVNDSRIITALGLEAHEKRRDYYTQAEILPAWAKLFEIAGEYSQIEESERTYEKNLLLNLARNVGDFEMLRREFDFAHSWIPVDTAGLPEQVYGDVAGGLGVSTMFSKIKALQAYLDGDEEKVTPELEDAMGHLQFHLNNYIEPSARLGKLVSIFPPRDADEKAWLSVATLMKGWGEGGESLEWSVERLGVIEGLAAARDDQEAFLEEAQKFSKRIWEDASACGEGGKIGMEVSFYKAQYFYRALMLFVLGFLLTAFSWLAPQSKLSKRLTWGVVGCSVGGLVFLVVGIVIRSIIQGRPPIYNLYDTILCVTAVAIIVSLLMEYVNRQRLGLGVSVVLGAAGMFLAMRFEVKNASDTMESMRAVLASNFWLSTHVVSVIIGYSGGLLAAGIAHVYILARLFGVKKGDREFYKSATRMTYGVLCFALFFALVGTVLGGIWANYSWGRFWGWDPKENGAFMIVLWCLAILHGRMGGYIRDLGVNICAVLGAIIVSFSWWGVNNLGVGLHSYGFTEGIWPTLFAFWGFELLVVAAGVFLWMREREDKKSGSGPKARSGPAAPPTPA